MTFGLLPVKIQGPVNEISPTIAVLNSVENATVQLYMNGATIASLVSGDGLSTQVPVAAGVLVAGQVLTATQTRASSTSTPSQPETVAAAPSQAVGLPALVFLSPLHPCVDWVLLGGAIPGVTAKAYWNGQEVGSAIAYGPTVSVPVKFPQRPNPGDVLEAFLSHTSGATTLRGPTAVSQKLEAGPGRVLPAPLVSPPFECDMAILVSGLVNGASLAVSHNGDEFGGYPFVGNAVWAELPRPVRGPDHVSARQELRDCPTEGGQSTTVGVNPAPGLPKPVIVGPICPNAPTIALRNLRPGAEVTVNVFKGSGGFGLEMIVGQGRAWATDCDFPLPPGWADQILATSQEGPVTLKVHQTACSKASEPASHAVTPLSVIAGTPTIEPPVECARLVRVVGLTPGTTISLHSDQKDWPQLSGFVFAPNSEYTFYSNRPLRPNEQLQVTQVGCAATATSAWTRVSSFGGVAAPVVELVRIPHGGARLRSLIVGARLHVFVAGVESASVDVNETAMFVPLTGLARELDVYATQTLCTSTSLESNHVPATLGHLQLSLSQKEFTRGQPTSITVSAKDQDNGQPVTGTVSIGGTIVAPTGKAFAFTFGPGAPPPSGVNAKDYNFAPISWQLKDPPAQLPKVMSLSIINQASNYFAVQDVTWSVERQELNGTFTLIAAPIGQTVTVSPPTPGQYAIFAEVSVNDLVNGGVVEAEFRGNAAVNGLNVLVVNWQNQGLSQTWRLVAEAQVIYAGGESVSKHYPVVAPA